MASEKDVAPNHSDSVLAPDSPPSADGATDSKIAAMATTDEKRAPTPKPDPKHDEDLRKSIVRKYDATIVTGLFVAYLLFYLDKSNIALARINGLEKDLRLSGTQFNTALVIFFVFNIAFNIPGNLVLRHVGGGTFLPSLVVAWGLVTTFSGFITNFAGLCVTRVFLGLAESSFLGSAMIYLGFFYTPDELITRVGIFFSSAALAGSIGGLLAAGLGQIRAGQYSGWPWIFFIEGLATVLVGVVLYFVLPNTPEDGAHKWRFSADQTRLAMERARAQDRWHYIHTEADRSRDSPLTEKKDRLQWATWKRAIVNVTTLTMALAAFFSVEAIYSYALFLPTLIQAMGFQSPVLASLLTVPPNFVGFLFTIGMCVWSQRSGRAATPINICASLGLLGYVFMLVGGRVGPPQSSYILVPLQYAGTFLVSMSVNAIPPLALSWMSINASPYYTRTIALGFVLSVGNLATFLASFTYIRDYAPAYTMGHSINLGCLACVLLIGFLLPAYMMRENRKRERGDRDYRLDVSRYNGLTREQHELQLGWLHPSFRFKV